MEGFRLVFTKKIKEELEKINKMLEEKALKNLSKIQERPVKEINLWGMKSSFLNFLVKRINEKDR